MGKRVKTVIAFVAALLIIWASVMVIFAENTVARDEEVMAGLQGAVNPYMAILAACIAAVVGIIIFVKRKNI